MEDPNQDVPSPIDLRNPIDAIDWVAAADRKRPWRANIRTAITELLSTASPAPRRVLEIGSGPGLLAEAILQICQLQNYTLFDFSVPMLNMSCERIGKHPSATFILGDFKLSNWTEDLGSFDAVVAMQAIHEIRHKRHAPGLYREINRILGADGLLVVCDHTPFENMVPFTALYSTEIEQHAALSAAGFINVRTHMSVNGLYICVGQRPSNVG